MLLYMKKIIRFVFAVMTILLVVMFARDYSLKNKVAFLERMVRGLQLDGRQKDRNIETQRKAFAAVTRSSWYYIETDTNNLAWVSTEPSVKGENKGEKLSFPLPSAYHAWLQTPIPTETSADRIPAGFPGDGLVGTKVKFLPYDGNVYKGTYDGRVTVEFLKTPLLTKK